MATLGSSETEPDADGGGAQNLVMTGSGENKIAVIKALREINQNWGLKEAKDMLRDLSGKMHEVISSFCLISRNKEIVKNEITRVYFKNLEPEEIKYYTDHFATLDKAGSYGIQDWIGLVGISHIEGSYFNVMGLPTSALYDCLKNF